MEYRIERDTLGEVKVPKDTYYGAQTQRAVDNFKVSSLRLPPAFIRAQAVIKKAAAMANIAAGNLDKAVGEAIIKAADEVMAGKFDDQFVVDVFQAGAGTSQNMNINEILAARASELLGGKKGDYSKVHPNDHPNMSQSTNDTIHVAIHISAYTEIQKNLLPALERLEKALGVKAAEYDGIVKSGRTHLQDAVPIRLGQEFGGYAAMIRKGRNRVAHASEALLELCIGGTAVGTGINTDPHYRENALRAINEMTGYDFREPENMFEAMQNLDAVVEMAGALRVVVTSLRKIADDFRLLSSGPRTGLAEIQLPPVQPGSSIMPGKVNPVMAEMLDMVCFQAMGCDTTLVTAGQAGQIELNVMMPVVAYNLLLEIQILSGGVGSFVDRCVTGITANEKQCRLYAEKSAALATALNPQIGYQRAAELAKEALEKDELIRDLVISKNIMDKEKLENILNIHDMTIDPADKKEK
ncbi:MAG: aspartate ammonia-lyase [candidate division Zixibacteria bacterium HGW-Zixibacteria-1]|nr:MAG: aspartate ammonia-lyase [candidate division Zixibacteria bacterium HGW-Zixibacteria-1]